MDKSRQQFECWYFNNHRHEQKYPLHKDESGEYFYDGARRAWKAWQASRESLINNSEPVAWMYPVFHDEKMQFTTDAVASENIDIHFQSHGSPFKVTPLYKLD